jgi:hypothetical protein
MYILNISMIALNFHFVPKFEPDAEIGQISADFEKCRFANVSDGAKELFKSTIIKIQSLFSVFPSKPSSSQAS